MAKRINKVTISPKEAFEAGQRAFAEGVPIEANPYPIDPDAQNHHAGFAWRRGWRMAELERDIAEGREYTRIYSVFPAIASREEAQAAYDERDREWRKRSKLQQSPYSVRDEYPALPWTMESLLGSVWINLHSKTTCQVIKLHVNTWGQREPVLNNSVGMHDDYVHCTILGLGFWSSHDRYVIEHWIRLDTLPADVQAA